MARTQYSEELKAEIVAKILMGDAMTYLSKEYGIPYSTLTSWKSQADSKIIIDDSPIEKKKSDGQNIAALLLEYLEKNLQAQTAQLEVFAEKDWIRQQDAQSIAILHGVLSDKAARMITAFRGG